MQPIFRLGPSLLSFGIVSCFLLTNTTVNGQTTDATPEVYMQLQGGITIYDNWGLHGAFHVFKPIATSHSVSAGLSLAFRSIDTKLSPSLFALGDSLNEENIWMFSLPIMYHYGSIGKSRSLFASLGIAPTLSGYYDLGGNGYEEYFNSLELYLLAGAGFWIGRQSIEVRFMHPITDPHTRPLNPPEFKGHSLVVILLGITVG
jgi:hypothetical protein